MAFPTTPILDDFAGTLGNWTNSQFGDGPLIINAGAVTGGAALWGGGVWTAGFGADCESYITYNVKPTASDDAVIWGRVTGSGGTPTGYNLKMTAFTGAWVLEKFVAGTPTTLASGTQAIAVGDSIGISVVGASQTAWYKASGGSWAVLGTGADTAITAAGQIGLEVFNNVQRLDNFGGGTVTAPVKVFRAIPFMPRGKAA